MAGSAADAIGQAVERSKQLLFQPLKPEKWFALGLTVFLAQCGEYNFNPLQAPSMPFGSGGGPTFPTTPRGSISSDLQKMIDDALRAFHDDLALYVTLLSVGLLLSIGLGVLVIWFSSRAKLMLVESVVHNRVDLGQQWTRAAELGMSVFKFRLLLQLGGGLLGLGALAVGVVTALSDFQTGHFTGTSALIGYALFGFATLAVAIPVALTVLLFDDFVLPLMVVRNVHVGEAWSIWRREVLAGNWAELVLFYILRVLLAFGIVIAVWVLNCVTCCIISLPYLGTVILLPVFVFWRAFSLYFMEQLGVQIFPAPEPSWQAYDQWRFPR
jgi:hypothetical protein